MTSEVLLMNMEAAVLAADSAVTLFDGNQSFSQSGVEKVFVINEAGPVAAMVFGNGAYAGYPWKTVLGDFARRCGNRPLEMKDYAEKLLQYLSRFGSDGELALEPEVEAYTFAQYVRAFLVDYRQWLTMFDWKPGTPFDKETAHIAYLLYARNIIFLDPESAEDTELKPRPAQKASQQLLDFFGKMLPPVFAMEFGRVFPRTPLPEETADELAQLLFHSLLVAWLPQHLLYYSTGMVISGFPAGRSTPAMLSIDFFGPFGGIVKCGKLEIRAPRAGVSPVIIETFAQADLTEAFLYGAMPDYANDMFWASAHLLSELLQKIIESAEGVSKELAKTFTDMASQAPYQLPAIAAGFARDQRLSRVSDKIIPLINSANADLLAKYAQKFMELPILEHELLKEDSVGRPVTILSMQAGKYKVMKDGVVQ